jgi:hypothetical protein
MGSGATIRRVGLQALVAVLADDEGVDSRTPGHHCRRGPDQQASGWKKLQGMR